jgi:hypothetical protein
MLTKKEKKYLKLAIKVLQSNRQQHLANASHPPIFDHHFKAIEHKKEYDEAITYFENLLEENKD